MCARVCVCKCVCVCVPVSVYVRVCARRACVRARAHAYVCFVRLSAHNNCWCSSNDKNDPYCNFYF